MENESNQQKLTNEIGKMEPDKSIPQLKLQAKKLSRKEIIISILIFIFVCLSTIVFLKIREANMHARLRVIGKYRVAVDKAFFYDDADKKTNREDFLIVSDSITAYKRKGDFLYTEVENLNGELQSGWLLKKDVITEKEWMRKSKGMQPSLEEVTQIHRQLHAAREFLANNKTVEALIIYSNLSNKEVPEAMYEYAMLAFKNINKNISCNEAFELLHKAVDEDYVPAKYTLGFLYAYSNDVKAMNDAGYQLKCNLPQNIEVSKQLLTEAIEQGDTEAVILLRKVEKQVIK